MLATNYVFQGGLEVTILRFPNLKLLGLKHFFWLIHCSQHQKHWGRLASGYEVIRKEGEEGSRKKTKLVPAGSSWLPQRFKSHLCLSLVNFVSPYTFIHICAFNCKRLNCVSRQVTDSILPGRKTPKDHPRGERSNMVIKTTKFRYQR